MIAFESFLFFYKKLRWYCLKTENDSRCWKTQLVLLFLVDLFTEDICFVKSGSVMRDRWSFLLTAWSKIIDRSKRWIGDRWSLIDFGELILDHFFPPLNGISENFIFTNCKCDGCQIEKFNCNIWTAYNQFQLKMGSQRTTLNKLWFWSMNIDGYTSFQFQFSLLWYRYYIFIKSHLVKIVNVFFSR